MSSNFTKSDGKTGRFGVSIEQPPTARFGRARYDPRVGDPVSGRRTWAEIDLDALKRNLSVLRVRAGDRRVIGVVKADAYGHGAAAVSRALLEAGCEALAVATLEEARVLREAGIAAPVLLLQGLGHPDEAAPALHSHLSAAVGRVDAVEPLEAAAARAGRRFPIHLKFDTGMGRLGFRPEDVDAILKRVSGSSRLEVEGLMSHLADADDPLSVTPIRQRERFDAIVARVRERGIRPPWIHMDSSAGVAHGPTPGTTAIRPGLALYGADPTLDGLLSLEPVMTLCSRAIHAKTVAPGDRIGYGGEFIATEPTRILTLPIGYADGLPRAAGGRFSPGLRGRRVPLVGRVSMDLATLDAGPDSRAEVGEEVLIFGRKADLTIRVEELAAAVGTIAYEVLVGIGPRVPRSPRIPLPAA